MRRTLMLTGIVAATLVLLLANLRPTPTIDAEVVRIRQHLERVSLTLRTNTPTGLSAERLAARRQALHWLDEYRANRVFPHNHVLPGARVPVFVDPHGTPCAVGYLMVRSGAYDLVERIVRSDNLVRVPDLRGDAAVEVWLEEHGLTLSEAAMIQPQYGSRRPGAAIINSSTYGAKTVGFSVATAALASYAAVAGLDAGRPWADLLTVGSMLGHSILLFDAEDRVVGDQDWAVGANAAGLVVGAALELIRLFDSADDSSPEPAVQAYVAPGPNGVGVGFALRR